MGIKNAALAAQRNLQHQAAVTKACHNNNDQPPELHYHGCDPADNRQLRGIPAVGGRGTLGGAITGTRPDTMNLDRLRRKL